jgi:hypothetical protein
MTSNEHEDDAARVQAEESIQALVAAYVACRVAMDALPQLPPDIRREAEDPLRAFCQAVEPSMAEQAPSLADLP